MYDSTSSRAGSNGYVSKMTAQHVKIVVVSAQEHERRAIVKIGKVEKGRWDVRLTR